VLEWAEAGPGDVLRVVEAQGVARARDNAFIRVGSRIAGQILKMHVRTGDVVRAGQLLIELDDRELQAQRRQAVAKLEAARNELARAEAREAPRLEEAKAALTADQGRRDYAGRLHEKRQALRGQGHVAQNDVDASRRDASAMEQAVTQDKAALSRVAKESMHDRESARKAVDQAAAALAQVDAYLSMTRIESPIDGIVGQVLTQEGEQVVAELEAVKILTVIDPRYLELWIYVNEADAAGIRPGMQVRFFQPSAPDRMLAGQVERVSPSPETIYRVLYYPAIATVGPDAWLYLRPEMNVQCFVLTDSLQGVLSVPNEAVVSKGGSRVVYVDDGQGRAVEVKPGLGPRGGSRTQVLSGISAGQKVAVKFAAKEGS
jgi:multidrug efflux pump subunit AcrA (membrane-fusion protein)